LILPARGAQTIRALEQRRPWGRAEIAQRGVHPDGTTRSDDLRLILVRLLAPLSLASGTGETPMIMFLVILLVVFWLLGMVTTTTLGGWLHILLVIAVIFLLIRLIRGTPV
jgi:hypothetical protein